MIRETGLAGYWANQLEGWIIRHGLRGYDPFDVKAHPLIRVVQPYAALRKPVSIFLDVAPVTIRKALRIRPTLNPKAFALVALAELRLYQAGGDEAHLERAVDYLEWLHENACPDAHGLAWGYPFDVGGKAVFRPAGTPVGVVSAIAGEAFHLAWQLIGDTAYRDAVCAVAEFIRTDLQRMPQQDGTICFSYTPVDRWPVHNANLHAAAHLYRAWAVTGDEPLRETAENALAFTLRRQRDNGSWPYGEWAAAQQHEQGVLDVVDHHHTGFVLRALHEIQTHTGREDLRDPIVKGFAFYKENLFNADGVPRITVGRTYPINIHACAEGIICPAVLTGVDESALELSTRTLKWTRRNMTNPDNGLPYYRKYPLYANKLLCTRWGLAWMFYALAEYLYRAGTVEPQE